jgi:PAS domain S-box-containing protein
MRERSGYLEALVEAAPVMVIGLGEDGTVQQWNRAAEQILGWAASEVMGRVLPSELWGPGQQLTLAHGQALRGHAWKSVELEVARRDGTVAVLSLSATTVPGEGQGTSGVVFIAQDITSHQNSLDTLVVQVDQLVETHHTTLDLLRRSEHNFRSLIEQSPEAVFILQDQCIAYVNPAGLSLLGHTESAGLLGSSWAAVLHPGAPVSAPASREQRLLRKDGRAVSTELTELALEFNGRPSTVVLARDITERQEMQARLLLADRLASVGTLATGVAHEINNPMAYVTANLSWLSSHLKQLVSGTQSEDAGGVELSELEQVAAEALEGARRVNRIVKELKLFARGGDERVEPVDVRAVVAGSLKIAVHELKRRAQVVLELEEVPRVLGSESQLGQVCLNLMINAGQAIPVGEVDRHKVVIRTRQREDGWVLIEVADTGCGISPEAKGRLFDPFFTTKPIGEGTGLGLSICHGIIKRLGGTIEVESAVGQGSLFRGQGSLFRVVLPPHAGSAAQPPEAASG